MHDQLGTQPQPALLLTHGGVGFAAGLCNSCGATPTAPLSPLSPLLLSCGASKQADTQSAPSQQRAPKPTGIPSDWQYQVGDVVNGVVTNLKPYGAFIKVDDVVGLLHISQITHERITSATVERLFQVGGQ